MKEILISRLSQQLCKFGLNPSDWLISEDQQNQDQYVLVNLEDPEFQIRGSVREYHEKRGSAQKNWSELALISI
jgi:hypothetical protein